MEGRQPKKASIKINIKKIKGFGNLRKDMFSLKQFSTISLVNVGTISSIG